jgi:hypothetical protein
MFRFEECQSIGENMRSANSREKVARKIAEAYGWERSSGSGAEEGMVEFMVGSAVFELRVAVVHVFDQAFKSMRIVSRVSMDFEECWRMCWRWCWQRIVIANA